MPCPCISATGACPRAPHRSGTAEFFVHPPPRDVDAAPDYVPARHDDRSRVGVMHQVLVTPEGYRYEGEVYGNLSPIANRITGTR